MVDYRKFLEALEGFDCAVLDISGETVLDRFQKPRIASSKPRIFDVSADKLRALSKGDNSGYNDGRGNIYIDKALSPENYLMVLFHELGHNKYQSQADAQTFASYALKNVRDRAKASDAKEARILDRTYPVEALDRALARTFEVGQHFPGFEVVLN